jgi:hypothetical protein
MNPDGTLNVEKPQTYDDYKRELTESQAGLSRQEIAQRMAAESEAVFDPETAVKPRHNWIDRGLVMTCEGSGHPTHRAYKRRIGYRR